MRNLLGRRVALVAVLASILVTAAGQVAADQHAVALNVRCSRGETISQALEIPPSTLTLVVQGHCTENVVIARDDVTLRAGTGGSLAGPDTTRDTISVTGSRVTIDGLAVTGGRDGVRAAGARGLTLLNCSVGRAGRDGVVFFQGRRDWSTDARSPETRGTES